MLGKFRSAWGSQPAAAPLPLQSGGYGNKVWGAAASPAVQPTFSAPSAAAVQDAPAVVAPAQPAFPTTTQQICTCVAVPAASATQQSAAAPSAAAAAPLADVPLQQAAPQTYSAPAAAPAAAAAAPAPAAQFYSAPVQQQAAPLFRPAPSAVRPSYTGY